MHKSNKDNNLFGDLPTPEEEMKHNVFFKFGLIAIVIAIVLISSLIRGRIQFKDFLYFNYSFSLSELWDSKEYIILFIVIIPLSVYFYISNRNWEREAFAKYIEEEEKKEKAEDQKKKEEFEEKMRSVHFKAD